MLSGWNAIARSLVGAGFLFLLAHVTQPTLHAQTTVLWVDCGGEDDAPCVQGSGNFGWNLLPANTPIDILSGAVNVNDTQRCDTGLWIHRNSDGTQVCANQPAPMGKLTVGDTDPNFNPPWLSFARQNQFDVIQADTPLTFAPTIGTHNSYSNYFDGGGSALSADQGFSITDQLQYGARTIRLDPWLFTNTDYQIRLCHASQGIGSGPLALCESVDQTGAPLSYNRPFVFAIKEIAHWLKQHPSESIVLRLHDSNQDWCDSDSSGDCTVSMDGLVETSPGTVQHFQMSGTNYFCWTVAMAFGNMVYKNPIYDSGGDSTTDQCTGTYDQLTAVPNDYRFPTLRQMRADKKQILIVSEFANEWAFEDANGTPVSGTSTTGIANYQTTPTDFAGTSCSDGQYSIGPTPVSFAEIGEDRSVSVLLQDLGNTKLIGHQSNAFLDSPTVKRALACGFTWMDADFFGTLGSAPGSLNLSFIDAQCDDNQASTCSTTDHRRENMIWSWHDGTQPTTDQPARMTTGFGDPFGSWVLQPPDSVAPYLCANIQQVRGFYNGAYPDNFPWWYITSTTGPWQNGDAACQSEKGSDWHFWAPASAIQNIVAYDTLKNSSATAAWLNQYTGNLQAQPSQFTFNIVAGQDVSTVPHQSILISGGFGGGVTPASNDQNVAVQAVQLYGALDSHENQDNASNLFDVSLTSSASKLKPGTTKVMLSLTESTTFTTANPGSTVLTPETYKLMLPVTVNVAPAIVNVTVATNPAGLNITVDGVGYVSPQTFHWAPGTSHTIDATQSPSSTVQSSFQSWSDGGALSHIVVVPAADTTYTANLAVSYLLTLNASGHGSVSATGTGNNTFYPLGSLISLTATPNAGAYFVNWTGALSGSVNPQFLVMNGPQSITAVFGDLVTIRVPPNPFNDLLYVDGAQVSLPFSTQWIPGSSHTLAFPLFAPAPGEQILLRQWSDGDMTNPRTIAASNATYTPIFDPQWMVTTAVSPAAAGQITAGGWFDNGAALQLNAIANGGWAFSGFTGDVTSLTTPKTVTVNRPLSIVANFTPGAPRINVTGTVIDDSSQNVALTLALNNTGSGAAANVQVTMTVSVLTGSGTVLPPVSIPAIATIQGQSSASLPIVLNWPTTANRIRLTVSSVANGGAYQASQILSLFR